MVEIGYKLSSEDNHPIDLVNYAKIAENAGFSFAMISDHYSPWVNKQNESPFVWSTLGGISQTTNKLNIGTAVTCPTIRIHPAIIAQAAATTTTMMEGRFNLGLGSGENLNEHILGDHWPPAPKRIEMLEEAIKIIRMLWQGDMHNFEGKYYTIQNAQVYTLPSELPNILMSADGELAAKTAGRIAEGLLITSGIRDNIINIFKKSGGKDKPCYAEATVCWANNEDKAKRIAFDYWPIISNKNGLNWEIQTPKYFEELAKMNDPESVTRGITCGNNPQEHIDEIKEFINAGYDHVFVHQLGPEQEGFINFYKEEVLPEFK